MKMFSRFVAPVLLLAVGLWACQDQVVTPEIAVSLETAAKKPPKPPQPETQQMWVGFLHPDQDPRPGYPFPDSDLDISAEAQFIDVIVDEYGELQIPGSAYELSIHFEFELANYVNWCESRLCTKRSSCPITEGFNMLQDLQNASDELGGLMGDFGGSTDRGGVTLITTIPESGPGYEAGEYLFQTCWLNCGGREHDQDIVGDFTDSWRILNAPIRVYRRKLNAKPNDPWTHRTTCGNWPPGVNRGGSYVVLGREDGG